LITYILSAIDRVMLVKISVNVQEKRKLWAKNMLEKANI